MRAMKMFLLLMAAMTLAFQSQLASGQSFQGKNAQWNKVLDAANKEGKVVVSIPTSAELRTQFETAFRNQFPGINLELNVGRGSSNIAKIVEEQSAGVHGIDVHVGGTSSIIAALLPPNFVEPLMPMMVLPEVKDPGNWWGGHMWADHAKKYVYSFTAYMTETVWYNSSLVKPEEIATYDDLLNPKWKGKIAILDPRNPGSGESTWAFLWRIKGEPFLKKLVAQDMLVGRNLRQLAEGVARGKSALSIGLSYYSYRPFVKAGLPVKPIRAIKEGFYGSTGSGNIVVIKDTAHPNAAKVFVNWLLSTQGQTVFTKALGQPTRRLDVDTSWTRQFGHVAAKDTMTPEKFEQVENSSEDVVTKIREPAMRLAKQLIK
jgi:ABC-type Fe3+ transport system substrate-binding protein